MFTDSIQNYRGDLERWAAECAMDGIRTNEQPVDPNTVGEWLEGVWEFVTATCDEEGYRHPEKVKAVAVLKTLVQEFNQGFQQ